MKMFLYILIFLLHKYSSLEVLQRSSRKCYKPIADEYSEERYIPVLFPELRDK